MKVLMFGWEYPPHISGGLGTACHGLLRHLSRIGDTEVTMVLPKTYGDEDQSVARLISADCVDLGERASAFRSIKARLTQDEMKMLLSAYISPDEYQRLIQRLYSKYVRGRQGQSSTKLSFTGKYGVTLFDEIRGFSEVGHVLGSERNFDVIHAHDWLTYPAGIAAKKASGKPLVVHIHATEFDRSGEYYNSRIYKIEKQGFDAADRIIAVSNYTRNMVIEKYRIDPFKVITIHNGVDIVADKNLNFRKNISEKIVTYLGRITKQKGPGYFIDAAYSVLQKMDNVRFVVAGTGDMFEEMIRRVAQLKISDKFHFTGFLNYHEVQQLFAQSNLYVMPSISEPFGISPLEAMVSDVPVIISKQSGVSEVLKYAIKVDFWDIQAMSDAMFGILNYDALSDVLKRNGKQEVKKLRWQDAAIKVRNIYDQVAYQQAV